MSKKAEFMKNAVLFGQQKPEVLGDILAGLVTDTLDGVTFIKPENTVEILTEGTKTVTYKATGVSQFGDTMGNKVTYSLVEPHTGATIDGSSGVLSVLQTTEPATIQVKATCEEKTAVATVKLIKAVK